MEGIKGTIMVQFLSIEFSIKMIHHHPRDLDFKFQFDFAILQLHIPYSADVPMLHL